MNQDRIHRDRAQKSSDLYVRQIKNNQNYMQGIHGAGTSLRRIGCRLFYTPNVYSS